MSTYRADAEAAAFHRRRLATAFLSGSPDQRTEPPRPGRCIIGGLLLAALCLAGIVVSSRVSGHPAVGWDRDGVHVAR